MTNSVSRAKDEKLRIKLLQTIFKFKKLANSGLGMRPLDGKQDISLAEFMLLRAVDNNSADSPSNVSPTDIGQFLSVTKGAVSQMLHSLEEKGFITRALLARTGATHWFCSRRKDANYSVTKRTNSMQNSTPS